MKGHALLEEETIALSNNIKSILKFFFRTAVPNSTKLDTKHSWVMGIQVSSNEGPCPSPKGDNSEIVKLYFAQSILG